MRIYVYFFVRVGKDYARSNEKDNFPKLNFLLTKTLCITRKLILEKIFDFS